MHKYPVLCYAAGCERNAQFKIAARWSDGLTHELKTYYLACEQCLTTLLASARVKQAGCRLTEGETLDPPVVYELNRGTRDRQLVRREDLDRSA